MRNHIDFFDTKGEYLMVYFFLLLYFVLIVASYKGAVAVLEKTDLL